LCGIAAMLLTLPASAQTQIMLDMPLDWQVTQRNAQEWAEVKVPVGIIACGIGATSVREWLPKGATFPNPPTLEGRVRQLPSGKGLREHGKCWADKVAPWLEKQTGK